jgi:hypothetical protein
MNHKSTNSSTLFSETNTAAREASFIHPRAGSDSDQHFSRREMTTNRQADELYAHPKAHSKNQSARQTE